MNDSRTDKPMLVGEANPYGGDPHFALYPVPDGSSGHRLCCEILGMRRQDYLQAFERRNLCGDRWVLKQARQMANELRLHGGPLILLGARVALAFGFERFTPFTVAEGGKVLVLPHPSGLSRSWNEVGSFERARALVAQIAPSLAHLLGSAGGEG